MPNWKSYESSVRLLSAIIAAHPGLKLNYDDVARYYGDGAKYKSVWDRMNIINKNAKAISAAVEAGQDPFAVPLDDTQTAAKSNKSQAIAGSYGEGVTENGAGGSAKKTPAKRTPSKKKTAAVKGENGDDDESMPDTPTKSALNKVKGGRVTKTTTPRRNAAKPVNYEESEDDEVGLQGRAKLELMSDDDISSPTYGNGHGAVQNGHSGHGYSNGYNGNGNGYSNPYSNHTMANDNNGYDDDDGQGVYFAAVDEEV